MEINYGPDGEENYANVYNPDGEFVGNLKTHHAWQVVLNGNAARTEARATAVPAGGGGDHGRLRPAGPAHPAVGWQPIETAPKDGTLFAAWRDVPTYDEDLRKTVIVGEPCIAQWVFGDVASVPLHYMPQGQRITHWMPLPDPPNQTTPPEERS
jgi:hypothetical protein